MDQQIDTTPLQDQQGRLVGYACEGAANDANVNEVATSFFFDLKYPVGQQTAAVEYVNQILLEQIAGEYHLISGTGCDVLEQSITPRSQDPQSSLVSIQSNLHPVQLFESCESSFAFSDNNVHACQTLQLILKGLVWNQVDMPDVIDNVEKWLEGTDSSFTLLSNNNNPYSIHYLGGQELEDYTVISTGADRPSYPAFQHTQDNEASANRNIVTGLYKMSPLGIAIVCLLVLAFIGLVLAFVRKQRLQRISDEEASRQRQRDENKDNENPVPEIDGEVSSSSPSSTRSDAFSMTGSTKSAISA